VLPAGDFSHPVHVRANVACSDCHTPPGMSARAVRCQSCHEAHHQPDRSCLSCHRDGVLDRHNRTVHVACVECHDQLPTLDRWTRQVCTVCHVAQAAGHYTSRPCEACHKIPAMRAGQEE
jgi:hypothetical protein